MKPVKPRFDLEYYANGIARGERVVLGQAITLVESTLDSDQPLAEALLKTIMPRSGRSIRLGITGVPGVGKSTFIEAFGTHLINLGKKVAVLTIDPSSQVTRGSILGDKTRMESLAKNPGAFIRPTASGNTLGGVASKTREVMLLCEAAGFDVIIVETVGVGQSEVAVRNMVDFFLLLMLAGAGDELQGIKKGIMEMADSVVITKADGDNEGHATQAKAAYQQAFHLLTTSSAWEPRVLTCSAITGTGIADVWAMVDAYHAQTNASGFFQHHRQEQNKAWFLSAFQHLLQQQLEHVASLKEASSRLERAVAQQTLTPAAAARELMEAYLGELRRGS